jgi:hypothetical protein
MDDQGMCPAALEAALAARAAAGLRPPKVRPGSEAFAGPCPFPVLCLGPAPLGAHTLQPSPRQCRVASRKEPRAHARTATFNPPSVPVGKPPNWSGPNPLSRPNPNPSPQPQPQVMYIIPSGQNPTGAAMGAQRRADIYAAARRHDLIIVEDDAYSWLQYPDGEAAVPGLAGIQREPGLF